MIISTPFIVLDKRPYRENALLLRGVSPDYGRVSFILHGGQSFSKSAPQADIFREVEVEFEDDCSGRELFAAKKIEPVLDFSAIALTIFFQFNLRYGITGIVLYRTEFSAGNQSSYCFLTQIKLF